MHPLEEAYGLHIHSVRGLKCVISDAVKANKQDIPQPCFNLEISINILIFVPSLLQQIHVDYAAFHKAINKPVQSRPKLILVDQ